MRTIEVCFGDRVDLLEHMARLDGEPPGAGSPLWESPLFIGGAADDPDVIRAAQELILVGGVVLTISAVEKWGPRAIFAGCRICEAGGKAVGERTAYG